MSIESSENTTNNDSHLKSCKILVVDDVKPLRTLIAMVLTSDGYSNIIEAENGLEALELVEKHRPDLIILDLVMPEMGGMEFCQRIRNSKTYNRIPIIIQTAMESNEDRLKAFEVGASDLITKPVNGPELLLRTKVHLQNHNYQKEQELYRDRVAMELSMARDAQFQLLPTSETLACMAIEQKIDVSSCFEPSSELGGDFWGIKKIEENKIGFHITDFSGHGVVSALNTIRLHTLLHGDLIDWSCPGEVLKNINKSLCELLPTGQFATIMVGTIDTKKEELIYASAAAPEPIMGQMADVDSFNYLDTSGLPLGIHTKADYEEHVVPFPKGSFLFSYSDALTETKHHNSDLLDGDSLLELVRNVSKTNGSSKLLDNVVAHFKKDCIMPLKDDLTVICFET